MNNENRFLSTADMPAANMQANYTWPKNPMADT